MPDRELRASHQWETGAPWHLAQLGPEYVDAGKSPEELYNAIAAGVRAAEPDPDAEDPLYPGMSRVEAAVGQAYSWALITAAERLATLYLEETGLPLAAVNRAVDLWYALGAGPAAINLWDATGRGGKLPLRRMLALFEIVNRLFPDFGRGAANLDADVSDVIASYAPDITEEEAERLREKLRREANNPLLTAALFRRFTLPLVNLADARLGEMRLRLLRHLENEPPPPAEIAQARAELTACLTRDGEVQPEPLAWLTRRGWSDVWGLFEATLHNRERDALRRELEETKRELARRTLPALRLGTRAVKTHTTRAGDYREVVRTLRRANKLTAAERKQLAQEMPIPLRGDELLVAAGLLEIAKQAGHLHGYGPARARLGGAVFDVRIVIDAPPLEELGRLLGFPPGTDGRIPRATRERVEEALGRLCTEVRPIVVESVHMERGVRAGKVVTRRRTEYQIVRDVPVRRATAKDGHRTLELHGTLALGYWWGHILLSPRKWEDARAAIGARYVDDAMKWADVYFRRLVLGVKNEHTRKATPPDKLADGLPKRLRTAGLLEELELVAYRRKKGPADTAERLGRILDFCVAAGSLVSWAPDGRDHYTVTLPHPVEVMPEDARTVQEEIFPALLAAGESLEEAV